MTEENYKYRTSPLFLRNQFKGGGKHKIPVVPRFQPQEGDFDDLLLIGFDKIRLEDQRHSSGSGRTPTPTLRSSGDTARC